MVFIDYAVSIARIAVIPKGTAALPARWKCPVEFRRLNRRLRVRYRVLKRYVAADDLYCRAITTAGAAQHCRRPSQHFTCGPRRAAEIRWKPGDFCAFLVVGGACIGPLEHPICSDGGRGRNREHCRELQSPQWTPSV